MLKILQILQRRKDREIMTPANVISGQKHQVKFFVRITGLAFNILTLKVHDTRQSLLSNDIK